MNNDQLALNAEQMIPGLSLTAIAPARAPALAANAELALRFEHHKIDQAKVQDSLNAIGIKLDRY